MTHPTDIEPGIYPLAMRECPNAQCRNGVCSYQDEHMAFSRDYSCETCKGSGQVADGKGPWVEIHKVERTDGSVVYFHTPIPNEACNGSHSTASAALEAARAAYREGQR